MTLEELEEKVAALETELATLAEAFRRYISTR